MNPVGQNGKLEVPSLILIGGLLKWAFLAEISRIWGHFGDQIGEAPNCLFYGRNFCSDTLQ